MAVAPLAGLEDFGALVDLAVQRIRNECRGGRDEVPVGRPVEDLPRERQVLAEAGRRAMLSGVDEKLVIRFLRTQISASKMVQRGMLGRVRRQPRPSCPTARSNGWSHCVHQRAGW